MVPIPYQPCSGWLDGLPLHICNSGVRPGRLFEGCWLFEAEGRHGQTLWTRRRIEDTRPSALTPPTPQTSHAGHRLSHRKKSISCSPQQPQTQLAHPRLVACLRRPPARHRSTSIGPHPPCSENREDRRDGIGSSVLLASFIQPPGSPEVPPHLSASWPQKGLSAHLSVCLSSLPFSEERSKPVRDNRHKALANAVQPRGMRRMGSEAKWSSLTPIRKISERRQHREGQIQPSPRLMALALALERSMARQPSLIDRRGRDETG